MLYTIYYILYTIYYILYTIYYILYTIYYILYTIYYILYTIYYILYTIYYILYTIYYILYTIYYILYTIYYILYTIYYILYTIYYILYTIYYILYTIYYILYTIYYILYTIYYILYTIYYILYTIYYILYTIYYILYTIYYILYTIYYILYTIYYILYTIYYILYTIYYILYTIYYILYTIYYILYTIYYILYTIYYILYTIYYILYTIYYILYTIYYILYTIYYILYTYTIYICIHILIHTRLPAVGTPIGGHSWRRYTNQGQIGHPYNTILNGNATGRTTDHSELRCICEELWWRPFARVIKGGKRIVMTTDASCLRNPHAEAVINLQAGFRPNFAPSMSKKSCLEEVLDSVTSHIDLLCERTKTPFRDITVWQNSLISAITSRLHEAEADLPNRPLTGRIDFRSAENFFKQSHKYLVYTRVDKAANCFCIWCKPCYIEVVKRELDGPGYQMIGDGRP